MGAIWKVLILHCIVQYALADEQSGQRDDRECVEKSTLSDLRREISENNLAGYIIPSEDAHLSEYVAPEYRRREYMTGLSGSAGIAVVLADKAIVSTDSRYCIAADKHVYCGWEIYCPGNSTAVINFITDNTQAGDKIGANPFLFTTSSWNRYSDGLKDSNIILERQEDDLVDKIWNDPPEWNQEPIEIHDIEYAGKTIHEKLQMTVESLEQSGFSTSLVTRLDDIAWLLNIRGRDIPYSPVVFAYFLFDKSDDGTWKYTIYPRDILKFRTDIQHHLCPMGESCVEISDKYNSITDELKKFTGTVLLPGTGTTYGIDAAVQEGNSVTGGKVDDGHCPIEYQKSIKNGVEIEWIRHFLLDDSIAICEALMMVENNIDNDIEYSEIDVANQLIKSRGDISGELYRGESFGAIAAAGPNGASNHYEPTEDDYRQIFKNETFLLDCGGQYLGGTSDVTRTLFTGTPTDEIKHRYTRVLQGNIRLANGIFPDNTPGYKMEPLARQPLFKDHQMYGHGTGHGIGYYLLVHEAPNGIGGGPSSYNYAGFTPGMLSSIEPGFYKENEYGIRLEDDALVIDVGDGYISFEKLNLVPYEPDLIDSDLLTDEDINNIDMYHEKCAKTAERARELSKIEVAEWIEKRITKIATSTTSTPTTTSFAAKISYPIILLLTLIGLFII